MTPVALALRVRCAGASLAMMLVVGGGACRRAPEPPEVGPAPSASAAPATRPCAEGALGCERHPTAVDALLSILERERPRVVGFGETHLRADQAHLRSTARRFREDLLPILAPRVSHLVLEIWVADPTCDRREVAAVARQQAEVTLPQAEDNPGDFVALARAARRLGVAAEVLRPACDEYRAILDAGAGDIDHMLEMIARLTRQRVEALLAAAPASAGASAVGTEPAVSASPVLSGDARGPVGSDAGVVARPPGGRDLLLTYGGALHNDLEPRPGRERWSFGPALRAASGDRYVEIDLILPEAIQDTEVWRALPWVRHYDAEKLAGDVVLFRPAPRSWVLVFARSAPSWPVPASSAAGASPPR